MAVEPLGVILASRRLLVLPLLAPADATVLGISDNNVHFSHGGAERVYQLPFYDNSRVSVHELRIPEDDGQVPVYMMVPDGDGSFSLELSINAVSGVWVVTGKLAPFGERL